MQESEGSGEGEQQEELEPIEQIIQLVITQQAIESQKVQVPTPSADLITRLFDFYLGPQQGQEEEGAEENTGFLM